MNTNTSKKTSTKGGILILALLISVFGAAAMTYWAVSIGTKASYYENNLEGSQRRLNLTNSRILATAALNQYLAYCINNNTRVDGSPPLGNQLQLLDVNNRPIARVSQLMRSSGSAPRGADPMTQTHPYSASMPVFGVNPFKRASLNASGPDRLPGAVNGNTGIGAQVVLMSNPDDPDTTGDDSISEVFNYRVNVSSPFVEGISTVILGTSSQISGPVSIRGGICSSRTDNSLIGTLPVANINTEFELFLGNVETTPIAMPVANRSITQNAPWPRKFFNHFNPNFNYPLDNNNYGKLLRDEGYTAQSLVYSANNYYTNFDVYNRTTITDTTNYILSGYPEYSNRFNPSGIRRFIDINGIGSNLPKYDPYRPGIDDHPLALNPIGLWSYPRAQQKRWYSVMRARFFGEQPGAQITNHLPFNIARAPANQALALPSEPLRFAVNDHDMRGNPCVNIGGEHHHTPVVTTGLVDNVVSRFNAYRILSGYNDVNDNAANDYMIPIPDPTSPYRDFGPRTSVIDITNLNFNAPTVANVNGPLAIPAKVNANITGLYGGNLVNGVMPLVPRTTQAAAVARDEFAHVVEVRLSQIRDTLHFPLGSNVRGLRLIGDVVTSNIPTDLNGNNVIVNGNNFIQPVEGQDVVANTSLVLPGNQVVANLNSNLAPCHIHIDYSSSNGVGLEWITLVGNNSRKLHLSVSYNAGGSFAPLTIYTDPIYDTLNLDLPSAYFENTAINNGALYMGYYRVGVSPKRANGQPSLPIYHAFPSPHFDTAAASNVSVPSRGWDMFLYTRNVNLKFQPVSSWLGAAGVPLPANLDGQNFIIYGGLAANGNVTAEGVNLVIRPDIKPNYRFNGGLVENYSYVNHRSGIPQVNNVGQITRTISQLPRWAWVEMSSNVYEYISDNDVGQQVAN